MLFTCFICFLLGGHCLSWFPSTGLQCCLVLLSTRRLPCAYVEKVRVLYETLSSVSCELNVN